MLSLFHGIVPAGGIEAFLDNSDSLWRAFDEYGRNHGYDTVQVFTIGQGLTGSKPVVRAKGSTLFYFFPKKPLRIIWPLFNLVRSASVVILNNEAFLAFLIGLFAKLQMSRVAIFYHNQMPPEKSKLPRWVLKLFRKNIADAYFTYTTFLKRVYGSHPKNHFPHPMFVFRPSYDRSLFFPTKRRSGKMLRLVYVGTVSRQKKIEDILAGMAKTKNKGLLCLTIVGEDPDPNQFYLRELQATAQRNFIHCGFPGHFPHSQLRSFYTKADVFINLRPDEGFGKVFVEAMATGLPIIGRKGSAGPEELIKNEWNGFLVESTDELATVLDRLLRNRRALQVLSRNATRFVRRNYSFEDSFQSLATALNHLLAG
jgi:glycosyltransferase involved in cell wall biosynthesis